MNSLPPEVANLADMLATLVGSYPVLFAGLACLVWAIAKKLMKLGIFAGICLLLWFAASNYGVQLPL